MSLSLMLVALSKNPCEALEKRQVERRVGKWASTTGLLQPKLKFWIFPQTQLKSLLYLFPHFLSWICWKYKLKKEEVALIFFLSQKVWRLAWAAFAWLLWLTYGLMTLRHRLVGKTTLEFPNEIVTVICFISALYCPISVWVEGCVWLPCKYFCFANYSFQRSCCLPGYVRTFVCLLCCVAFLNCFVWLFWFCLFGFFCKQCLSDIWLLFYFFFFT